QPRECLGQVRQPRVAHGAEPLEQLQRLEHRLLRRRLKPAEAAHILLAPREQLQDWPRKIDAANLRFGLRGPMALGRWAPEPDANARLGSARAPGALFRRRARDLRKL